MCQRDTFLLHCYTLCLMTSLLLGYDRFQDAIVVKKTLLLFFAQWYAFNLELLKHSDLCFEHLFFCRLSISHHFEIVSEILKHLDIPINTHRILLPSLLLIEINLLLARS